MTQHFATVALTLALLAGTSAPLSAQSRIDYETGEYLIAEPAATGDDEPVVTLPVFDDETATGAQRVIPARQVPRTPPPIYVVDPVVQPIENVDPQAYRYTVPPTAPVAAAPAYSAYAYPAPAPPAGYAYPGTYAYPYAAYAAPGYLPAGARMAAFDRRAWLFECRSRLAGYDEDERDDVIAVLGGPAVATALDRRDDRLYGPDECEIYLDAYIARARSGALTAPPVAGQRYMLVPVTVAAPRAPVYREYAAPPK